MAEGENKERDGGLKRITISTMVRWDSNSEDVGEVAGNEYLELLNLVRTLAWNQPSMMQRCSTSKSQEDMGLYPQLFYTDSPDVGEEAVVMEQQGEQQQSCEVHEESLDVITRTAIHPKESPHHADYCGRVKELVGFEFPPVMSQYLELMVHNHWARWRREGLLSGDSDTDTLFHSIAMDAHMFLIRLIRTYIIRRSEGDEQISLRMTACLVRNAVSDVTRSMKEETKHKSHVVPEIQEPRPSLSAGGTNTSHSDEQEM